MSRDLLARLARFGFWLGLICLATVGATAVVLGNPNVIKQAARDSSLYDAVAGLLTDMSGGQLGPVVQPAVETAAANALTPEGLQASAEEVIDGTYRWLDGTDPQPQFKVDLAPLVSGFTAKISDVTKKHLASLPACTPVQLQSIDLEAADPLSWNCLPPGLSPDAASQQVIAKLQANNSLLQQPVLTADNLPKDEQGKTFFQASAGLPGAYQAMQLSPWLIGGFVLLMAFFMFILLHNPMRAVYTLAKTMLWAGLLILGIVGLGHLLFNILTQPGGSIANSLEGSPQEFLLAFIRSLEGAVSRATLMVAAIYVVVGWVAVISLRLIAMRLQKQAAEAKANTPATPTAPTTSAPGQQL